jgi:UDP-N-acetylglucosamine 2-epimerase (non-hydrolysing)/GDP/UDP-N,N'-diacetylbacillosamine 2-epimerase (hydrolysing)
MPRKTSPALARRRVCFVTGSRAEFGLMRSALDAIQKSTTLKLQIIATGMHLDAGHGRTLDSIREGGWRVDAAIPWNAKASRAMATGEAIAAIAGALTRLKTDIVLVVGDRVEAFAGATAGHLLGLAVAHVHGGDRALGLMDDTMRHAITKLAHVHFPATEQSVGRIARMGEDEWRIHRVGSPGIDDIRKAAATRTELLKKFSQLRPGEFALLALHPSDADEALEFRRADMLVRAVRRAGPRQIVIIYPNNDPGSGGIIRRWRRENEGPEMIIRKSVPRSVFLGLLREAAYLAGNTSSGIIEAGSFQTPVIDIGPRQTGREHGAGVVHVNYALNEISKAISGGQSGGRRGRSTANNPYEGNGAGAAIARKLASLKIDDRLLRKIICY